MSELRFTEDHEWIRVEGEAGVVGISQYAQSALGDAVFVELPEIGKDIGLGEEAAVIESVKAASEIYTPLPGRVVEVNARLEEEPGLVNSDPMGEGWFFKIEISDTSALAKLMDEDAYNKYLEGLD